MPNTVLGRVKPIPRGEWSNSAPYTELDIVSHDGSSYIALQDVPSGTALSNTSYWDCIVKKGDKGDTGEITGATASISGGYGTPSVSVTEGGTSTDRSFAFAFSNLVGDGIDDISVSKTGTSGAVDTYTMTITMDSGDTEIVTWTVTNGSVTSVNGRTGAVTGLAEQDGYYEDMSVGSAEQLISSTYVSDSVPYVFRTSGGSADIGDRDFEDAIVGGTVAWNQLAREMSSTNWALFGSASGSIADGVATVTASALNDGVRLKTDTKVHVINGHLYYMGCRYMPTTSNTNVRFNSSISGSGLIVTSETNTASTWNDLVLLKKSTASGDGTFAMQDARSSGWDAIKFKDAMVIDLTQMFGSTIADYIYSLEQSEAGKGVAWFKTLFPKPYYAYNAGSLIHVNASAHETTGFNQWDEVKEQGGYSSSTGEKETGTYQTMRNKNPIHVVPSTSYYFVYTKTLTGTSKSIGIYEYDASGNFLGSQFKYTKEFSFSTSANTHYINFRIYDNGITDYSQFGTACINLHWDGERDGEYEPYVKHEYALDSSLELRGIPKLDTFNKLYWDGDEYANDGSVTRNATLLTLDNTIPSGTGGIRNITSLTNSVRFEYFPYRAIGVDNASVIATNFVYGDVSDNSGVGAYVVGTSANSVRMYFTLPSTYNTEELIRGWFSDHPTYVVCEVTPTTESADAYTSPQIIDDFGTEWFTVVEQSGVVMPVGHISRYTNNLRAKLEMAPESPSSGNGDYIVRQTNGVNTYVPLTDKIPDAPTSADGTFVLKATVSGGTATLSWVEET